MIFSSLFFLWVFLPSALSVYYLTPPGKANKYRNIILLMISIIFYAFGDLRFVLPIIFLALLNYLAAIKIHGGRHENAYLALTLTVNLSVLIFYKYLPNLNVLSRLCSPGTSALPLGISFFTFQNITYIADVYRGKTEPEGKLCDYLLYIFLFPQLIAGPIIKYTDQREYIKNRAPDLSLILSGFYRFGIGLAKKTLLAGNLSLMADEMFDVLSLSPPAPYAWLGAIAYTMQIYYDFSGYSDMAIGLGMMFGFKFAENFNYPYLASGPSDFFRRWHMTLTDFFREYVYIPLGGSRHGRLKTLINTLIVFILTGLWHGGQAMFIVWGLYNGIVIALEKVLSGNSVLSSLRRKHPVIHRILTLLYIIIGWVIFRSSSLNRAISYLGSMFSFNLSLGYGTLFYRFINVKNLFILLTSVLFSGPFHLLTKRLWGFEWPGKFKTPITILLITASTIQLIISTYTPFIYFRF